ncbi:MAG: DUF5990 family protein [Chitinophagaceae bacterium]
MNQELILRIILETPPPGIDFGLQKGSGNIYETIQTQRSKAKDLQFDVAVQLKATAVKSEAPNFVGSFVQGTNPDKFIYLDIGTYAGQKDSIWGRRLKIPLKGITWEMIDQVQTVSNLIIQTAVPGTGKDGGPNCATVKPFLGWNVKKQLE